MRTITIPIKMYSELMNRLEEVGAVQLEHQDYELHLKLYKSKTIEVTQEELENLMWHAITMIEIAAENESDREMRTEADGARQFILSLKETK